MQYDQLPRQALLIAQTTFANLFIYFFSRQIKAAASIVGRESKGPGMDDLDAGLHARPGPVVGDGAHDAAEPQRPFE